MNRGIELQLTPIHVCKVRVGAVLACSYTGIVYDNIMNST